MKKFLAFVTVIFCCLTFVAQAQERENLGFMVNSKYNDNYPVISPDGKTLYFGRSGNPDNKGEKDIFYSKLGKNGRWSRAIPIGSKLNNKNENIVVGVSGDNNQILLFWNYNKKDAYFSKATKTEKGWSKPQSLLFEGNKEFIESFSGSLASDGKTVVLHLNEAGRKTKDDLYVSFITDNGTLTDPLHLGNTVNSSAQEMTPYLSADMKTLYFSSTRPGGEGGADIYYSKRLDDSWTNWTVPKNMGKVINSPAWELYFTVSYLGDYAYFSSTNSSLGGDDIFRISLKEEQKPEPTILITGTTLNKKTGKPISTTVTYESTTGKDVKGSVVSSSFTGKFQLTLPKDKYEIQVIAENFYSVSENIDLEGLEKSTEILKELVLIPLEEGETIRMNNIFFDFGKSTLRSESFAELDRLIDILGRHKKMEIEIGGHTDNIGDDASNKKLSQERADSVVAYLISKGVDTKKLESVGYGESVPEASNDTEEGREQNRRVVFTILKMK
jgi:outer membrane protein OmpA-like peptidoglycan-associated protein